MMNTDNPVCSRSFLSQGFVIRTFRYMGAGIIFFIGFLLSPVTWWNDLVVNLPIAWIIASLFPPALFKVLFVFSYWVTNILGLLMMHYSRNITKNSLVVKMTGKDILKFLIVTTIYTAIFFGLMYFNVIKPINIDEVKQIMTK
ncbi:MAG: hypothetical protein HQL29_01385 [Candidatus Omnitrophica bacterium]|nr:hypothetical protein [Candidatus Omnitrophota bacterium]